MKQRDNRRVVVLEHVASERAGTISDFLKKNGIRQKRYKLYKGASLPSAFSGIRAVVVMGGPMNVYEEKKYPFLKSETAFLKAAIRKGIPCLGVCLGSQLLAKALGSKVYKAKAPEVGWGTVRFSRAGKSDPIFKKLGSPRLRVLQWHGDTFDIPRKSARLASSALVPNQAFRHGKAVYGFQFHVEVDRAILKKWFRKSEDLESILAEHARYEPRLKKITDKIYGHFFSL